MTLKWTAFLMILLTSLAFTKSYIRRFASFNCRAMNKMCFSTMNSNTKLNLFDATEKDLEDVLLSVGESKFRAKQIRSWLYEKGVTNFDDMTDLSVTLRMKLKDMYKIGTLKTVKEVISKDGTQKRIYALHDSQYIESVRMPYEDGRITACISSQAGCAMGCKFCSTGQMGFFRQLTSTEIFEQVQRFNEELLLENKRISNVVFMGMGEPLMNFDNVMVAIDRLQQDLGIGKRHITLSTVGVAPRIIKLAKVQPQINLAISLHQVSNEKRSNLMPVNNRFPLEELRNACVTYIEKTNRRITFEWALIDGVSDSPSISRELGHFLKGLLCHVNVIPLNPTAGYSGKPSSNKAVNTFVDILEKEFGIPTTIRVRRGLDIDAGCGQLKAELLKKKIIVEPDPEPVDLEKLLAELGPPIDMTK